MEVCRGEDSSWNSEIPFSEITSLLNDDLEYIIPAHISRYLKCNDVPDDRDIEEITNILRDLRQDLERIDEDAKQTARAIETLQRHRAAVLETESKLRSTLSPIRRFPAEILFEIFLHTIERHGYSVLEASEGPWSLSRVSRHWRATALTSSGALWSDLNIGIHMYSVRRGNPISRLRTCLARSGRHNISVFLHFSYPIPTFEDKVKEMVQLLINDCERWRSFEISNSFLEIHSLLGKVRGRVPNLRNLVIRCGSARVSEPLTAFELAPELRTVEIHDGAGVVLGPGNPSLVSYVDRRYRSSSTITLDSYFTILHSCRQHLQIFAGFLVSTSQRSHGEKPPIILPQLKHFRGSHRDLIRNLTMPNLETFHLDVLMRPFSDNVLLDVHDLFIRSGCQGLSELTLTNAVTSHVLDILPLLPALIVLDFRIHRWRDKDVEEDVFRRMFKQMTDIEELGMPKLVPNLREFSFMVIEHRDSCVFCLDGIFLDMVVSRAKTLKKVDARGIVPRGMWSPKQVSVFEGLLEEGVDISLNHLRPWDFSGGLERLVNVGHVLRNTSDRHIFKVVRRP
ncbi:hypothetical protein F5146DRAFT_1069969 [Armillaria mellea]|nr:hypothetical protein F5146DRAFT_1069969 [Armillaria mellea]